MHIFNPSPPIPRQSDRLSTQILIGFGLLGLLVAAMATVALGGIASVRGSVREALDVDEKLSQLASEVSTQTLESRRYEKDFFLNAANQDARDNYLAKWQTAVGALDQAIAAFAAAATTAEDQQQASNWHEQVIQYNRDFGQIARLLKDGSLNSPQAANTAFAPFKENIRILAESSAQIADRKATLARTTSSLLEATSTRAIWSVGLLAALALLIAVGYSSINTTILRHYCEDCNTQLSFRRWLAREHVCSNCGLQRLAQQIDEAEKRRRSK